MHIMKRDEDKFFPYAMHTGCLRQKLTTTKKQMGQPSKVGSVKWKNCKS